MMEFDGFFESLEAANELVRVERARPVGELAHEFVLLLNGELLVRVARSDVGRRQLRQDCEHAGGWSREVGLRPAELFGAAREDHHGPEVAAWRLGVGRCLRPEDLLHRELCVELARVLEGLVEAGRTHGQLSPGGIVVRERQNGVPQLLHVVGWGAAEPGDPARDAAALLAVAMGIASPLPEVLDRELVDRAQAL